MNEVTSTREKAERLHFLYWRLPISKTCTKYWLTIPEFVDRVFELVQKSVVIDYQVTLSIMEDIYPTMVERKNNGEQYYDLYHARKAINQLIRAVEQVESGVGNLESKNDSGFDNGLTIRQKVIQPRFVYRKLSMKAIYTEHWLTVPEFVDGVFDLATKGQTINDESVLPIMERVFAQLDKQSNPQYDMRKLYRGLRYTRDATQHSFNNSGNGVLKSD